MVILHNFKVIKCIFLWCMGGAVTSWLVRSSSEWVVWVQAGGTVMCSWARQLPLTVPLSIQEYKWVLANCWGNLTNCRGVTCDGLASRPGREEILLATSCDHATETGISFGSYQSVGSKASPYFHWCTAVVIVQSCSKIMLNHGALNKI